MRYYNMWLTPRLHMEQLFPRINLLKEGYGIKALFPRIGLLLGWYNKEE